MICVYVYYRPPRAMNNASYGDMVFPNSNPVPGGGGNNSKKYANTNTRGKYVAPSVVDNMSDTMSVQSQDDVKSIAFSLSSSRMA